MPTVQFERVLSVNSEDIAYPAENLLKPDNSKKWKCKAGEKQASVILQLKEEIVIEGIDIGNENSAFVEILVGKSSSQNSDFKVLLVTSSLMTLKEAKDGTNTNSVRFFKNTDLSKPTANEKWDRVKIVCTQPFNKHVQYGLAFVVVHSSGSSSNESGSTLGRFALKEDDNELPVAVGSWFAKRKDPPPPIPPGAAAAIRDASSPSGIAQGKNKRPAPKIPKKVIAKNGVLKESKAENLKQSPKVTPQKLDKPANNLNMSFEDDDDSPADDTDADSTYSPNKDTGSVLSDDDVMSAESGEENEKKQKRPKRNKTVDADRNTKNGKVLNGQTPKRKNDNTDENKRKALKVDKERKPFSRLLEGVIIVISGYQNPLRGELRSKAGAMGAKYKADWDRTCTHLICAFVNTPKFNQVRGRGKIVKKEWIEDCYNRRRRLPWRRFALDRNDVGTSSEEEIWEEESVPSTSSVSTTIASGIHRRSVSSGSDTEEEIERVRARQTANKPVTPSDHKVKESKKTDNSVLNKNLNKTDPFEDDTDVDSGSESQTAKLSLPHLPEFFDNIVFHIACDIDDDERRKLKRYITAYKGYVLDEIDGNVEYTITKLSDTAAELAEEFGISAVTPEWVWACSDAEKLVPVSDYLL
ncbi:DNA repair protein XRCC1 [Homalodisca vitripennis]|uniref:DNA repair protein XRCC1 n=1 Tax=Homalodisca vitripennis TaxID=197043 RepID=UPI001EEB3F9D|nr:DNA repair protein XRCC1 [Homalodisca vitripennis]